MYSVKSEKRAALDAYSHPSILFRTGLMMPLRLSTITLIRSSIRKALSRRITRFSSAIEKHVIIATDTMLKNEKMIIIFHRRAAHALLNFRKVFTSLPLCARSEHAIQNVVVTGRGKVARHRGYHLKTRQSDHSSQRARTVCHACAFCFTCGAGKNRQVRPFVSPCISRYCA
jgi:hypothetical protein